jgi:hypothetical protein
MLLTLIKSGIRWVRHGANEKYKTILIGKQEKILLERIILKWILESRV